MAQSSGGRARSYAQEAHPSLGRRLDDEIRLGLSALSRPSRAVEAQGVAAVGRKAKHPADGARRANLAAVELADLLEPPAPGADQVLIGVEHAPINMNDVYLIQGAYPVRPSLPSVVGNEGVGRVLAVGRGPLGIDGVAGKATATIAGVLSESGTLLVYALMSGEPVTIAPLDLIAKRVVVKGFFLNHPDVELKIPNALRETAPLVASGVIRVPIAATYRLTAFREAVAHVQRGGKVVFDIGE